MRGIELAYKYYAECGKEMLEKESPHLSVLALAQKDWVREIVGKYIRLFLNGRG